MRKMSCAMVESVSQKDFYGKGRMHYMAAQAITSHNYDQAHDEHLALQDQIHHAIAFLAEMMGDIMHLHQALWQPYACQFVNSFVEVINGQVDQKHWLVIPKKRYQRTLTSFLQYGLYNANAILQQKLSQGTRPDSTFMEANKSLE
jgi:hypothetical protein